MDLPPGLDLRILRRFRPERSWVVEPGDLLYLPPRVARRGTAVDPCMTFSIGFRAPSRADLLGGVLADALAELGPESLYEDRGTRGSGQPGEIAPPPRASAPGSRLGVRPPSRLSRAGRAGFAAFVTGSAPLDAASLSPWLARAETRTILLHLVRSGLLAPMDGGR